MQQRQSNHSQKSNKKHNTNLKWLIAIISALIMIAGVLIYSSLKELGNKDSVSPPMTNSSQEHAKPPESSAVNQPPLQSELEQKEEEAKAAAKSALEQLSLEEKIGQLLFVDMSAVQVEHPTKTIKQALDEIKPGGVILFRSDADTLDKTIAYTSMLSRLETAVPAWIGVDQEGGVVSRFPFMSGLNGNMAIAASNRPSLASETGKRIGLNLQALGMNVNFAPVADVNSNARNPVIGIRSFGSSADLVSRYMLPMIEGMHEANIPAVVKHFPGHGDTNVDSHVNLPVLKHTKEQLESIDLKPFQDAIDQGVDMVMSAHVAVPALDSSTIQSRKDGKPIYTPASLSKELLTNLLRTSMDFQGVIITDAMNMGAIEQHFGIEEASEMAINAGADVLLMPAHPARVKQHLIDAVLKGRLPQEKIDESVLRVLTIKAKYGLLAENREMLEEEEQLKHAQEWIASNGDLEFALQVARLSTTLEGDASKLPFIHAKMKKLHIVGTDPYAIKLLNEAIQSYASDNKAVVIEVISLRALSEDEVENKLHLATMDTDEDGILFVTRDLQLKPQIQNVMTSAIAHVANSGMNMASVSIGSPYDTELLEGVPLRFLSYGATTANIQAVVEALFASDPPPGRSPVE